MLLDNHLMGNYKCTVRVQGLEIRVARDANAPLLLGRNAQKLAYINFVLFLMLFSKESCAATEFDSKDFSTVCLPVFSTCLIALKIVVTTCWAKKAIH